MKTKDIIRLSKQEREEKIEELKLELIKARVSASKAGNSKTKEIKRIIARIITLNKSNEEKSSGEELKN